MNVNKQESETVLSTKKLLGCDFKTSYLQAKVYPQRIPKNSKHSDRGLCAAELRVIWLHCPGKKNALQVGCIRKEETSATRSLDVLYQYDVVRGADFVSVPRKRCATIRTRGVRKKERPCLCLGSEFAFNSHVSSFV